MEYIRQCELRADNHRTVTWLPEKIAWVGNRISFRDDPRDWIVALAYDKIEEDRLSRKHHKVVAK